jgi:hypothetical protein
MSYGGDTGEAPSYLDAFLAMRQRALETEMARNHDLTSRGKRVLTPGASTASTPITHDESRPRADAGDPHAQEEQRARREQDLRSMTRLFPTSLTPEAQTSLLLTALNVPEQQREEFLNRPVSSIGEIAQLLTTFNLAVIQPTLTEVVVKVEAALHTLEHTVLITRRELQWLSRDSRQQQVEFARLQVITHGWPTDWDKDKRHTAILTAIKEVPECKHYAE